MRVKVIATQAGASVSVEDVGDEKGVTLYVIYARPSDYPEHFVVRRWDLYFSMPGIPVPCGNPALAESLELARAAVPAGCVNLGREPGDDPTIVESWMFT